MTQRADRIVLEYTPDDFYFVQDKANLPSSGKCNVDQTGLTDYEKQLCLNQQNVSSVMQKQQEHAGMERKIYDSQSKYYTEVLKSFNLGIGIVGIISFLYYNLAPAVVPPPA
jgi:preprotein translocase subunit Sss1